MKRRRFQSIALIPNSGYVAICEEGRGWVFTFDYPKWRMLLELPPIEEPPNAGLLTREEYVKDYDRRHGTDMANQGLGRQDLAIRDWANLAAMVNQAERLLIRNINDSSIDLGCVLRSLIEEIRNELGLPRPSESAQ
jgi:hypothetical protein